MRQEKYSPPTRVFIEVLKLLVVLSAALGAHLLRFEKYFDYSCLVLAVLMVGYIFVALRHAIAKRGGKALSWMLPIACVMATFVTPIRDHVQAIGFAHHLEIDPVYSDACLKSSGLAAGDTEHVRYCESNAPSNQAGIAMAAIVFDPEGGLASEKGCSELEQRIPKDFPWVQVYGHGKYRCQKIIAGYFVVTRIS